MPSKSLPSRLGAAALLLAAPAFAQGTSEFAAPVKLEAGGAVVDTVDDIGHAGPLLRDHDGDNRPDLLVSSFRGTIRFHRNVGTAAAPRFAAPELLQAGGQAIRIHNW